MKQYTEFKKESGETRASDGGGEGQQKRVIHGVSLRLNEVVKQYLALILSNTNVPEKSTFKISTHIYIQNSVQFLELICAVQTIYIYV